MSEPVTKKNSNTSRKGDWKLEPIVAAVAYLRTGFPDYPLTLQRLLRPFFLLVGDVQVSFGAWFETVEKDSRGRVDAYEHNDLVLALSECERDFPALLKKHYSLPVFQHLGVEHLGVGGMFYSARPYKEWDDFHLPYVTTTVYPSIVISDLMRADHRDHPGIEIPNSPAIRDALREWYAVIDETGAASSGIGICDIAQNIEYGCHLGKNHASVIWPLEVEYQDWLSSGEERHNRVRAPAWCTYLSKLMTNRFDPERTMVAEFLKERGDNSTQHAEYFPTGGSIYFVSVDPTEITSWSLNPRISGAVRNTVWLWQQFRKAGMI